MRLDASTIFKLATGFSHELESLILDFNHLEQEGLKHLK